MTYSLKGKKVLIVDDDPTMLEIIKEILRRSGAVGHGAITIEKGMNSIAVRHYDAVILDRCMPKGDGHDMLRVLKGNKQTADIPVIMLTGERAVTEIKKSISLGAAGYIAKPFTPVDFLKQLDKILAPKMYLDIQSG